MLHETMEIISPAKITWQVDALGNTIPKSDIFDDVYYSVADGLNESRYVFIEHNYLVQRFKNLFNTADNSDNTTCAPNFTILELGFGTGLNALLTWQLWQDVKKKYAIQFPTGAASTKQLVPHLHIISTEKHPLTYADLRRSLSSWQQQDASLTPFITQLLTLYPPLVAGCHRLHLAEDVTLDLWFGEAVTSLDALDTSNHAYVDAWYLDGFAPSCNEALWTKHIFDHMQRLSKSGSTASTFSCAGLVKRGLTEAGFEIKKVAGFGQKKHMLTAKISGCKDFSTDRELSGYEDKSHLSDTAYTNTADRTSNLAVNSPVSKSDSNITNTLPAGNHYYHVAVIGAGISGLMTALVLATRGINVTLCDKSAPLAGASGNPRALLAPKMTPLTHVAGHLHTISYLYSSRFYKQLNDAKFTPVFTPTALLDLLVKTNVDTSQISAYPDTIANVLSPQEAQALIGLKQQDFSENLYLPKAGLINPQALAETILRHPNITFKQADIAEIATSYSPKQNLPEQRVTLTVNTKSLNTNSARISPIVADAVVIAAAYESQSLDARVFDFRKIRGQLSWFKPSPQQLNTLPKVPLKYNGYCALFQASTQDNTLNSIPDNQPTFLLGASFVRNDLSLEVRQAEHAVSLQKLITAIPELETAVTPDNEFTGWHARVSIRAQTPDYHPVVGQVDKEGLIWTLSGMGSKGFAFAPICAEVLADMMMGRFVPLSKTMLARLSPHRKRLQQPLSAQK